MSTHEIHEYALGEAIFHFEVNQIELGLRGPLPNTPSISQGCEGDYIDNALFEIEGLYGRVTGGILLHATSLTPKSINRTMERWYRIRDRNKCTLSKTFS